VVVQHEASAKVERMDLAGETVAREGTALVEATALVEGAVLVEGAALMEATEPLEQTALPLRPWPASQEAWLDLPIELVCVRLFVSGACTWSLLRRVFGLFQLEKLSRPTDFLLLLRRHVENE